MNRRERALRSILRQAEAIRPASETEDEQMYYLIGGIIANAEDALGALEAERADARFNALLRGGISFPAALRGEGA